MISEDLLYEKLGKRIRKLREGSPVTGRLTQAELAAKVGLERTSITNIEKGVQKVPLHVLYRFCEIFQVELDELLPKVDEVCIEADARRIAIGEQSVVVPAKAAQIAENILASIGKK